MFIAHEAFGFTQTCKHADEDLIQTCRHDNEGLN